jgi:hypothetical protein
MSSKSGLGSFPGHRAILLLQRCFFGHSLANSNQIYSRMGADPYCDIPFTLRCNIAPPRSARRRNRQLLALPFFQVKLNLSVSLPTLPWHPAYLPSSPPHSMSADAAARARAACLRRTRSSEQQRRHPRTMQNEREVVHRQQGVRVADFTTKNKITKNDAI